MASAQWGAKDAKTMSNTTAAALHRMLPTHKLMGFIRSKLTSLAVLCLVAAIAPQAVAQVPPAEPDCGPTLTLTANQWTMVGIPCVPNTDLVEGLPNNSIGKVFGPTFAGAYGKTWIVWNRVYEDLDPDPDVVDPNDRYTDLSAAYTVSAGDAFWVYTTENATLDFTPGATSTLGPYFEFPAVVAASNTTPRYYMFANPYDATVNWEDLTFASGDGGRAFKTKTAVNLSIVGANIHYWNGNTYYERSLDSFPVATFEPKEAAWLEMLEGVPPLVQDLQIQVPAP
jgi:hypothetical protein